MNEPQFARLREHGPLNRVYEFLSDMPKGGLLHAHLSGSFPFDSILEGLRTGRYWVKMSSKHPELHPQYSLVTGRALKLIRQTWTKRQTDDRLFAASTKSPRSRPKPRRPPIENPYGFRQWSELTEVDRETVRDAILLREIGPGTDAARGAGRSFHPSVTSLPSEFFLRFTRIDGLSSDLIETKRLLKDFLDALRRDGVSYVELMVNPLGRVSPDLKSIESVFGRKSDAYEVLSQRLHADPEVFNLMSAEFYLRKLIDATYEFNAQARRERTGPSTRPREVDARFLLGMNRNAPLRTENISHCLELVRKFRDCSDTKYRDRVVGVNLVADEFGRVGRPSDFFRTLISGASPARSSVDAITLHAGESVADDGHPLDSMLMGARRLGHGLSLKFSPRASALVRKRRICIEACPLSNKFLGFYPDLEHHPAKTWIRNGYRVCLNTDDPGIFDTRLTHDFYFATLAFGLSLRQIRELCLESLRSAFIDDASRRKHIRAFDRAYQSYVKSFVP